MNFKIKIPLVLFLLFDCIYLLGQIGDQNLKISGRELIRNYYSKLDNIHSVLNKDLDARANTREIILNQFTANESVKVFVDFFENKEQTDTNIITYLKLYENHYINEHIIHEIIFLTDSIYDKKYSEHTLVVSVYTVTLSEERLSLQTKDTVTFVLLHGIDTKSKIPKIVNLKKFKLLDTDGDGFPNIHDQCPFTFGPINGCPDKDGDKIIDLLDECPDIYGSSNGNCPQTGCPDRDGDCVSDQKDKCPDQFGKGKDDCQGCPDRDGDCVIDSLDKCPDQFGIGNGDCTGCPDRDGDCVIDQLDQCPDLFGLSKGACLGCPDKDGDCFIDTLDKCPDLFGQTGKGACLGCPDQDGDCVLDHLDKCPSDSGNAIDGCKDSDGDGLIDILDACPDVFSKRNNGCPDLPESHIVLPLIIDSNYVNKKNGRLVAHFSNDIREEKIGKLLFKQNDKVELYAKNPINRWTKEERFVLTLSRIMVNEKFYTLDIKKEHFFDVNSKTFKDLTFTINLQKKNPIYDALNTK